MRIYRLLTCKSFVLWLACLLLCACGTHPPADPTLEFGGITMGTTYTIKLLPPEGGIDAAALGRRLPQILTEVDNRMSTYQAESELSRLNRNPSTEWIQVSPELFDVLQLALEANRITQGAFDITVGPLVNLWGFGPDPVPQAVPDDTRIRQALERTGIDKLELDPATHSIRKRRADLYLDLSGIAKGYAVDQVADYLDSARIRNYLVEVGGEIRASGHNGSGMDWRIGIEKPESEDRQVQRIIRLNRAGMATSGDYRNFYTREGRRYAHIIDPRTGRPVDHALNSVSILHETCAMADALATGLLVLGPEQALTVATEEGIAAYFVIETDNGLSEKYTPEFAPHLADGNGD